MNTKQFILEFFVVIRTIIRRAFHSILYKRLGTCKMCGRCCRHVYLRNRGDLLSNFDEYLQMLIENEKLKRFQVKGRDAQGYLFFACSMVTSDNRCKDHANRPLMCRAYPDIGMIMYDAVPKDDCGFYFINRFTRRRVSS
ncbi:MAG: YkgJ family cysteine cluster protein [Candidatus Omnitrophica bacterium]|nr:YkgJ family cysteine cluster protein [Candidatus Omnitrophota bacterium]